MCWREPSKGRRFKLEYQSGRQKKNEEKFAVYDIASTHDILIKVTLLCGITSLLTYCIPKALGGTIGPNRRWTRCNSDIQLGDISLLHGRKNKAHGA